MQGMTAFHSIRVDNITRDHDGNYLVSVVFAFNWRVHRGLTLDEPPLQITLPADTPNIERLEDLFASANELEPWILRDVKIAPVQVKEFLEHKVRGR